jgi:hypothetical protein
VASRIESTFGGIALVGFAASAVVHLSTFFVAGASAATSTVIVGLLHIGLFPPFAAMVVSARAEVLGMAPSDVKRRVVESLPRWARVLVMVAFYYALINFGVFMLRTGGADVQRRGDGFALVNHGRLVREVTRQEAQNHQILVTRGFSGHWMVFYLLPAVFFLARRDLRAHGAERSPPPSK